MMCEASENEVDVNQHRSLSSKDIEVKDSMSSDAIVSQNENHANDFEDSSHTLIPQIRSEDALAHIVRVRLHTLILISKSIGRYARDHFEKGLFKIDCKMVLGLF